MRTIFTASLLMVTLLTLPACEESTEPEPWSGETQLHQMGGCQAQWLGKSALVDSFTYQFEDDLILDFYVESNCCPDSNRFELFSNVGEDSITITVADTAQHLCHCTCPYHIQAEFTALPMDEYTVEVVYDGEVIYLEVVQRGFFDTLLQQDTSLAFYRIKPDTLNAYEAIEQALDDLELAEHPILDLTGITGYEWSDHSFTVTTAAYTGLEDVLGEYANHIGLRGAPFLLMVNGERIYLGAFWTPISSIPPPCPSITFPPLAEDPRTLHIAEPWGDAYPDLRNDPRIYEALEASGVLREDYPTLEDLEVSFLDIAIWLDRMPAVWPPDTSRFHCLIDLELRNTNTDKAFSRLIIPACTMELDSTGELVGNIDLATDWDGLLAAGERDTVRLVNVYASQPLFLVPCDADVIVKLRVDYRWETSPAYQSDPVEFECTY